MSALAAVAARLRCPHCGAALSPAERSLRCARGHSYDVARAGHVSLPAPRVKTSTGDSAEMVAARNAFLGAGHYAPLARALLDAAERANTHGIQDACVVDLGAGTGYHLAALLGTFASWRGLALDASRPALRSALRAHPRIAAVVCDVWHPLPLRDGAADLLVSVFAPRNAGEIARVLSPGGALIVVTPTRMHLHQVVSTIGMIRVDPDKQARLSAKLSPYLRPVRRRRVDFDMTLDHDAVRALVAMGPNAHHLDATTVQDHLERLPQHLRVTASTTVETLIHS
jgi:23S rRNA (guanine745-N1)-methyltransferase